MSSAVTFLIMSQLKHLFVQTLWNAEPFFAVTSLFVSCLAGLCLVFVLAIVRDHGNNCPLIPS